MELHVGTSGYSYNEWKGGFYPSKLPASGMLSYYAERFSTVEINSTFYRLPAEDSLRRWGEEVPEKFSFAFKAPQLITHRKRLREVEEPTARFFQAVSVLNGRLGPVLFQLPPNFKKDLPRLESFLSSVPSEARVAFGFRHASWFDDDVSELLGRHGRALCIEEDQEQTTPVISTADWGYVRLRREAYDDTDLSEWAERMRSLRWSEVYVYFMHEDTGTGPRFAKRLQELFSRQLKHRGAATLLKLVRRPIPFS